jgi:acetyl-CoA carboxylase biotin carboxyl carrier protein
LNVAQGVDVHPQFVSLCLSLVSRMDLQKIKQLIEVLAASDLDEIELVEGEHRVRLVRRIGARTGHTSARKVTEPAVPSAQLPPAAQPGLEPAAAQRLQPSATPVCAPLYGIVHLTSAPDAPLFVQPGDRVQAGQTVCVIEAMKMFHEVKLERPGRIVEVMVAAGAEVEAGTPLFMLDTATDHV